MSDASKNKDVKKEKFRVESDTAIDEYLDFISEYSHLWD